jgi:hypothetical protein
VKRTPGNADAARRPLSAEELEQLQGLRLYRKHLNPGGEALLRELELRAGEDTDAEDAMARALAGIWIVTRAKATSSLADICFEVSARMFALQIKGGLDESEIVAWFADERDARTVARRELRIAGAYLD